MRANKTNVYELYGEFYDNNESVGVTFDVKNIVLIANAVNTVKGFLYLGKALPFAFFDYCHPFLQSNLRSGCASAYSFNACSVNILIGCSFCMGQR